MKTIPRIIIALLLFAFSISHVFAQAGTTSKGTEFWTAYMDHIAGAGPNASSMILYITSDVATSGTVSFADGTASQAFNVIPSQVTFVTIPASQFLGSEGQFLKGIHITALKPVAVYAHIYASSVSGATLLLPVNTLGKNYYSLNYTQKSNSANSYSAFIVIATEDSTQVQITPSALLLSGKAANTMFTITLKKGELYQGLSATDLTGTVIKSVSTATGTCKKIAVFSGSSKIGIGCSPVANLSSDNLFQQVYPTSTWGKNYITVALASRQYDVFRIFLSDPTAIVTLNGNIIPAASFTNNYYEFNTATTNSSTNYISANKPIQVIQYTPTQTQTLLPNCKTVADTGDPEMIYLSPIEQGLNHVTLYSTGYYKILSSYINIVIPNTGVSSFTLDGVSAASSFAPVPANPAYSYAQILVSTGPQAVAGGTGTITSGTHNIAASVPFNAIAYGFGGTESYGYAAGTNLQNLNEFVALNNITNNTTTESACVGATYNLQLTLPYQTTSISWNLNDGNPPLVITNPTPISTTVKGTQTLYTYAYPKTSVYTTAGAYTVVATVFNPTADDCGSSEDVEFDFSASAVPAASFTAPANGCVSAPVTFTDQTNTNGVATLTWGWDFGDAASSTTANPNTSAVQNPQHTYTKPGDYMVTLNIVNANGCPSSYQQPIHINALPVASFTYSAPDCETKAVTFTDASTSADGAITTWAWDFGDGTAVQTNTNNAPFTHVFAKAGNYTVKLTTTTSFGCNSASSIQTVVINPLPVVDFTLPTACLQNSIAQFTDKTTITNTTGKPFTYTWNFGDVNATTTNPNTSAIANPTHQFTAAGVYHVSLTVLSNDGCTSVTTTKDYTVSGKASFTAPASACPADLVTFTDQSDPTNKATTAWAWDFGDGTTANVQNPQHGFVKPGDYTVTLTVTGNAGCSTTAFSQPIHISTSPVGSYTYSAPDCETKAVTFTDASTSAESKIVSWIWDFGDGTAVQTNTTNAPFTHVFAKAGTYIVKLLVTTAAGCTSSPYTQSVIINPLPVVDFTLPTVCLQNATAQFTDNTTVANTTGKPFTYAWNFGDTNATTANPNTSAVANPTHVFTAAGVYHISLTVTSNDACTSVIATKDYTVSGKASFTAPASACPADVVTFTDQSDPTNKVSTAWAWDFGDGQKANVQNPTHAFANSGNYTVTLTVSGNAGCSTTTFSQPIHITASPVAKYTYSTPDCETRAITFTDASTSAESPIASWIWDFGDGTPAQTNTSAAAFTHIFASAGTFTVNLHVITASGCSSTLFPQTVIISPLPVVNFSIPDVCLADASAQFTDQSTIADNSNASFTYSWNFGDPNATAANPNTSTAQNPTHKYSAVRDATNPYIVTLTVTSKNGCTVTKSQPFTVNGSIPKAAFTVENPNSLCSINDVVFDDNSTVDFGNVTKIVWYFDYNNHPNDATVYTKDQFTADRKYTHNYGLFYTPATQTYAVKMEAYSGGSCVSVSAIQNVTVKANPSVTLSQIDSICQEASPVQIVATVNNGLTGTSVFSGTGVSSSGLFDPAVAGPGTYTLNYTFTAVNGCDYTTTQQVTVNPTPTANAGPDIFLLVGGQQTINATASGVAPLKYKWTLANGNPATWLDHDDILNPITTPLDNVVYLLTVTSANGCTASSKVNVTALKAPEVPNTFTPNSDGVNDTWDIKYLDTYPNATIEIYNRYGEKLYSSIGYPIPWDGNYKGSPLPAGVYYYIINPKNGRKVISGSVTIIR